MEHNFNARTQSKKGSTADWENYNPVLKDRHSSNDKIL